MQKSVSCRPAIDCWKVNKPCMTNRNPASYRFLPWTNKVSTCRKALYVFTYRRESTPARNILTISEAVLIDDREVCHKIMSTSPLEAKETIKENLLLHAAIRNDSSESLETLMGYLHDQDDSDVLNAPDMDGNNALLYAIEQRNNACIEIMARSSPNWLFSKNKKGDNSLHALVRHKNFEGCQIVLRHAPHKLIHRLNNKHNSALHLAAKDSSSDILKLLLSHGANLRGQTLQKYNALHFAVESGSTECVAMILSRINETEKEEFVNSQSKNGTTALMIAAKKGFTHCGTLLGKVDVNLIDKEGYTALHYAAKRGLNSFIQLLLEKGADISKKTLKSNQTALDFAVLSYNELCLSYLLNNSLSVENPPILLKSAVSKNKVNCLKVLLSRPDIKVHINHQYEEDNNNTLLHISIKKVHCKITRELLEHNANKEIRNDYNEYPLHLVAQQRPLEANFLEEERLEECKKILRWSHGLVNATNKNMETPLHLGAASDNAHLVRSLIKKGSRTLAKNNKGFTPVHVAALEGNTSVLKILLKSLSAKEMHEVTSNSPHPLHLSAKKGCVVCCESIMKEFKIHNKVNIKDETGAFPIDVAFKHRHFNVFQLLLGEIPYDIEDKKFAMKIHGYFEKSLESNFDLVIRSIIESDWCQVCFNITFCESPTMNPPARCDSFRTLIKKNPELACRALDQYVTILHNEELHSFIPFEFIFYNRNGQLFYSVRLKSRKHLIRN